MLVITGSGRCGTSGILARSQSGICACGACPWGQQFKNHVSTCITQCGSGYHDLYALYLDGIHHYVNVIGFSRLWIGRTRGIPGRIAKAGENQSSRPLVGNLGFYGLIHNQFHNVIHFHDYIFILFLIQFLDPSILTVIFFRLEINIS